MGISVLLSDCVSVRAVWLSSSVVDSICAAVVSMFALPRVGVCMR